MMKIIQTTELKEGDNILLSFSNGQQIGNVDYVNKKANRYRVKLGDNSFYIGSFKNWMGVSRDIKLRLPTLFKKII